MAKLRITHNDPGKDFPMSVCLGDTTAELLPGGTMHFDLKAGDELTISAKKTAKKKGKRGG